MLLENVVIGVANPREGAQDRDDDEDVGDDTASNHSGVLYGTISDDVDALVDEPSSPRQCASRMYSPDVLQDRCCSQLYAYWCPP